MATREGAAGKVVSGEWVIERGNTRFSSLSAYGNSVVNEMVVFVPGWCAASHPLSVHWYQALSVCVWNESIHVNLCFLCPMETAALQSLIAGRATTDSIALGNATWWQSSGKGSRLKLALAYHLEHYVLYIFTLCVPCLCRRWGKRPCFGLHAALSYALWLWKTKSRIAALTAPPPPNLLVLSEKKMAGKGSIQFVSLYSYHVSHTSHQLCFACVNARCNIS